MIIHNFIKIIKLHCKHAELGCIVIFLDNIEFYSMIIEKSKKVNAYYVDAAAITSNAKILLPKDLLKYCWD